MDNIAIKVDSVSKVFKLPHEKQSSVKGMFVNLFRGRRTFERQKVLSDISFDIKKGEFFGVIGRNGSGKSTLLKLLASIYSPTKGIISLNGSLTPFIELGVGFNPELTGRENVFLNGALLGFNRKEIGEMYKDIVEFAELENFMDQKLKNYSSGMQVRLAFSVAIKAESEILLIDEVLAVGDVLFQQKCFSYFEKLKKQSKTVVFVSHDRGVLEKFCDRGVLIDNGRLVFEGDITTVLEKYDKSNIAREDSDVHSINEAIDVDTKSNKKLPAQIVSCKLFDKTNKQRTAFLPGEEILLRFQVGFNEKVENPVFGITINNVAIDFPVLATNTIIEGQRKTGVFNKSSQATIEFPITLFINNGTYTITPAVANSTGSIIYHNAHRAIAFKIISSKNPYSLLSTKEKIKIS